MFRTSLYDVDQFRQKNNSSVFIIFAQTTHSIVCFSNLRTVENRVKLFNRKIVTKY